MVKEAEEAEGAEGAGREVFWLGCLIMVNHPDLISKEAQRLVLEAALSCSDWASLKSDRHRFATQADPL